MPFIAAILCAFLIFMLFRMNREPEEHTSIALWIPTFWLFIAASRNVSEWLRFSGMSQGQEYTEGSPFDRAILTAVLALGVIVVLRRARRVLPLLRSNLPIILYFLYCGISILWSDFPDVSFKRWFRALGDIVMVLIVLSDENWLVALKRLLYRVGFVVMPLSILFIRYFPQLGRLYTIAGSLTWTGVGTDKNALGMICLVFGLANIFRFMQLYRGQEVQRRKGPLYAQGLIMVMTLYLLYEAHSATSLAAFFLALGPLALTYMYGWARRPIFLHTMVFSALGFAIAALFLNVGSGMVHELGRDTTLTGRTNIWHFAILMVEHPLLGAGFESFWVGPRLAQMEVLIDQGVNQAHNGYIEVYLNLGWLGLFLLLFLLLYAYRRISSDARLGIQAGSLRLAYFVAAASYNFTEAGFKMMHPVWLAFLLAAMVPPAPRTAEELPPRGVDYEESHDRENSKVETARVPIPVGSRFSHNGGRKAAVRTR
jgi:exopolysaccharide production protein ExoQ